MLQLWKDCVFNGSIGGRQQNLSQGLLQMQSLSVSVEKMRKITKIHGMRMNGANEWSAYSFLFFPPFSLFPFSLFV
jgi:hypothetical protein